MNPLPSPFLPCPRRAAVVRAAFVVALFGWGVGFYGPPVFLHAVMVRTGWPLTLVSAAVTVHFLFGAAVVAGLPGIHRRLGIAATTLAGALLLAAGVLGWAAAARPWQLFVAALFTGAGWVPLGAAGINAIIARWFAAQRPLALARAYNGASAGGVLFAPLWAVLIERAGFPAAALIVGLALVATLLSLSTRELAWTPHGTDSEGPAAASPQGQAGAPVRALAPAAQALRQDGRFLTLAAAMALGLFAQIGLIAQLFALMAPSTGARLAGALMALATGCAIVGRLAMATRLRRRTDRRRAAAASYLVQAAGTLLMAAAGPQHLAVFVVGIVLFGLGIGNATSMPPLIAQAEFPAPDVARVVARSVALSQALYAFAPAAMAALIATGAGPGPMPASGAHACFAVVFLLQVAAAACLLRGRRAHR